MREVKLDKKQSANLVIDEAIIFWEKAKIPTSAKWYCINKLEILYKKYRSLQKSASRRDETQIANEDEFLDLLDDLFDIAATDALETMKINEDKEFLINQRKKGRIGCLGGVDICEQKRVERKQQRLEEEEARKRKAIDEQQIYERRWLIFISVCKTINFTIINIFFICSAKCKFK